MARKLKSDRILFLATILLVGLSIVMVYSASALVALDRYHQPYFFLTKQLLWASLGVAVLWLVAVLFGPPVNNARRWFSVGGLGIQPSELAKLAAIFFIAALLERRMNRINELGYALGPIILVIGAMVMLILLEPDF